MCNGRGRDVEHIPGESSTAWNVYEEQDETAAGSGGRRGVAADPGRREAGGKPSRLQPSTRPDEEELELAGLNDDQLLCSSRARASSRISFSKMVPYSRCRTALWILAYPLISTLATRAQQISTSTPLPPLQWINLTQLLSGPAPAPPLKDASIGYDDVSRNVLIFGGESSQGFPQSQTYLLNLESLQWIKVSPPDGLEQSPPARSAAIGGEDSAASYRGGHIIIGGKAVDGTALSDVWEFDYNQQFWSEVTLSPGGPSARWGAVGGSDPRTPFVSSSTLVTPNNSFYLAGGFDGQNAVSLSDVWRLNVTGTLSSNNAQNVFASWEHLSISTPNIPSEIGSAGAVIASQIVSVGGCSSSSPNASCVGQTSFIIDTSADDVKSPAGCPAPRLGATLVPNMNTASNAFGSQIFLLLGTFNDSLWQDDGGLERGEVAVLDVNTGAWTRVLPAGDPGKTGVPAFPSPRQGAAAVSFSQALVGDSRSSASDTLVFGGQDASGNYLAEVWLLRAYNAVLQSTNQTWSGGSGQLQTGVNANGAGVTIQYMTECASALAGAPTSSSGSTKGGPSPTHSASPTPTQSSNGTLNPLPPTNPYDTSVVHKSLAAISVAIFLPSVALFRFSLPPIGPSVPLPLRSPVFWWSVVGGLAAYIAGIIGLATSFSTIKSTAPIVKRASSSLNLKTAHGQAGIALFALFYGLVPLLYALLVCCSLHRSQDDRTPPKDDIRLDPDGTTEKLTSSNSRAASPSASRTDGLSVPRSRHMSFGSMVAPWTGRRSSESASDGHSAPTATASQPSFEVTNRPIRTRRASGNSLAAFSDPRPTHTPRNLSDMSWLERRRSLTTVGELDYNLTRLSPKIPDPSTPGTVALEMMSTSGLMQTTPRSTLFPEMPSPFESFFHVLFHSLLLALCGLTLSALWLRAPRATFIVFLIWTVIFYAIILTLAWHGRPRISILSVLISRLRGLPPPGQPVSGTPSQSRPLSINGSDNLLAPEARGPYLHQPPFRTTLSAGHELDYPLSVSHDHGTVELDDDANEDEDAQQRRIEEEMSRREVSIVTVPRRKLFLTNPEERHT